VIRRIAMVHPELLVLAPESGPVVMRRFRRFDHLTSPSEGAWPSRDPVAKWGYSVLHGSDLIDAVGGRWSYATIKRHPRSLLLQHRNDPRCPTIRRRA
jgi:hypothetical protein